MKTLHFTIETDKTIKGLEYNQTVFDISNANEEILKIVEKAKTINGILKLTPSKNKLYCAAAKSKATSNLLELETEFPMHIELIAKFGNFTIKNKQSLDDLKTKLGDSLITLDSKKQKNVNRVNISNKSVINRFKTGQDIIEDTNFLFKIINVSKCVYNYSKDGKGTFIGEYDYTESFKRCAEKYNTIINGINGRFSNIPKKYLKVKKDEYIEATILEDYAQFLVEKGDPKYKEFLIDKKKLWLAEFNIKIKLGRGINETSEKNIKEILELI
jgi:RNase P/RNase MRP subunit p29